MLPSGKMFEHAPPQEIAHPSPHPASIKPPLRSVLTTVRLYTPDPNSPAASKGATGSLLAISRAASRGPFPRGCGVKVTTMVQALAEATLVGQLFVKLKSP